MIASTDKRLKLKKILIDGFGTLFVLFNAFGLGLRLRVGELLAQAFVHWKIAVWAFNFLTPPLERELVRAAIPCLLMNLN